MTARAVYDRWQADITAEASGAGLDPTLVAALITVESNGDPFAWNPEPRYRYLWDVSRRTPFRAMTTPEIARDTPPNDFPCFAGDPDQEWWGQRASWGLMQVMGAVARERGFRGPYLTALVQPQLNLSMGCGLLASLFAWANQEPTQAVAAYNGGRGGWLTAGPQDYARKVLAVQRQLA